MDRFKEKYGEQIQENRDKIIMGLLVIAFILGIIATLVSYDLTNTNAQQARYVKGLITKLEEISQEDLVTIEQSVYELNKKYQFEIEIKDKGEVVFSTLKNFGSKYGEKEELKSFLSREIIDVDDLNGSSREIWVGVYNNFNYKTFNTRVRQVMILFVLSSTFMASALYIAYSFEKNNNGSSEPKVLDNNGGSSLDRKYSTPTPLLSKDISVEKKEVKKDDAIDISILTNAKDRDKLSEKATPKKEVEKVKVEKENVEKAKDEKIKFEKAKDKPVVESKKKTKTAKTKEKVSEKVVEPVEEKKTYASKYNYVVKSEDSVE